MKPVRLPLIFFVLYFFVFLLGGLSASAPFLATVKWSYLSVDQANIRLGYFMADHSDSNWVLHWRWCDANDVAGAGTTCDSLRIAWLAASVLWSIHLPLVLVNMVLLFHKPHVAYWIAPISFILQIAGGFCFVFRVPPMFRELIQFNGPTTSVSWAISWAGGVAIAAAVAHFIVVLLMSYFHRRLLGLDKDLEMMFMGAHFREAPPPLPPKSRSGSSAAAAAKDGDRVAVGVHDDAETATTTDEPALVFQGRGGGATRRNRSSSQSTTTGGGGGTHQRLGRRDMEPFESGEEFHSSGTSAARRRRHPDDNDEADWKRRGGHRSSPGGTADVKRRGDRTTSYFTDDDRTTMSSRPRY